MSELAIKIDKPGIYDIPEPTYHADPCVVPSLSGSIAVTMYQYSPRHAWLEHPRLNPDYEREEKAAFDIGSAAHQIILGKQDKIEVLDFPDWRTNAAKDARAKAYLAGKTPLLKADMAEIMEMVSAFDVQIACTDHANIFKGGKYEQTLVWTENVNGVEIWCRCMIDHLNGTPIIPDYKTDGRSANPETWSRQMFEMGYDIKAALYLRGVRKVLGIEEPRFVWVVQEKDKPYAMSLIELNYDGMVEANKKLNEAMRSWAWCMKHNIWPGYPSHVTQIGPKPWESIRLQEKLDHVQRYSGDGGMSREQLLNFWTKAQAPTKQVEGN